MKSAILLKIILWVSFSGVAGASELVLPADPIARAAFEALEKSCARCHQEGRLVDRERPAGSFGNILKLDEVAKNKALIIPGNPYASYLFKKIINQEMPYDVRYEGKNAPSPDETDIKTLESWIQGLQTQISTCEQTSFIRNRDIVGIIAGDLEKVAKQRRHATRYLTFTHLKNVCTNDQEMKLYRQATVKLLNSLSRKADVVRPVSVDSDQTIIRINLDELGWQSNDWDAILSLYPYNVQPDTAATATLRDSTGTNLPYVRADWFAFAASQAPLYSYLLKLPNSLQALAHGQGINIEQNIRQFEAQRIGFQKSGVSQNNRLIERHQGSIGYFWTSYDFVSNRVEQNLFERPLGPGGSYGFQHDGGETIFSLPNGFQAYFLSNAKGELVDKAPTAIVRDLSRRDLAVTNGVSCIGCHDKGIRSAKDEIRNFVLSGRAFPNFVREAVEQLYPPAEKMDQIIAQDTKRFMDAMGRASVDPAFNFNGVEMINALAKRYEEDIDLLLAAAELGLTKEEFLKAANDADKKSKLLVRRLEQGVVSRDLFESVFKEIGHDLSDDKTVNVANDHRMQQPRRAERTFNLFLTSNKDIYELNETPVFTLLSTRDCYLTLTSVDDRGDGTVLFPNRFSQNNLITANVEMQFPDAYSSFQYRLKDRGFETVVAVCSTNDIPVDGIGHDFGRSPFTRVENYAGSVAHSVIANPKNVIVIEQAENRSVGVHPVSRTAIRIEVR